MVTKSLQVEKPEDRDEDLSTLITTLSHFTNLIQETLLRVMLFAK